MLEWTNAGVPNIGVKRRNGTNIRVDKRRGGQMLEWTNVRVDIA